MKRIAYTDMTYTVHSTAKSPVTTTRCDHKYINSDIVTELN